MKKQLKNFLEELGSNEELKAKFETICSESKENPADEAAKESLRAKTIILAGEYGIELTEKDFDTDGEELNDEELESIFGGAGTCSCFSSGYGSGTDDWKVPFTCSCSNFGFGGNADDNNLCGCSGFGQGDSSL